MADDQQLLRDFAEGYSQEAFTLLVQRHVNLVYSAALRQLGGDSHLAWDASQSVFLALAQNASRLVDHRALTGWLYTTTHFVSAKIVRKRQRSHAREEAASAAESIVNQGAAEPDWSAVRPLLDAAMHEIRPADREVLLLRHFEGRSFAEIGRLCGLGENSARMRVERALDKLHKRFARHGITSTAAALGAALTAHGVGTAPAGLAGAAAGLSFAGCAATAAGVAGVSSWVQFLTMTHLKVGATAAVLALGIGGYVGAAWQRGVQSTSAGTASNAQEERPSVTKSASATTRISISETPDNEPAAPLNPAEDAVNSASQKAMAMSVRSGLDQRYGHLFRRFKLAPAELEKFRDLLTERQLSSFDAVTAALSQGVNVAASPGEVTAVINKVRSDVDENIRAFLGEPRYQSYQEYNANASSYALLELIERRLDYTDAPLQEAQSESLLPILTAARNAGPPPAPAAQAPLDTFAQAIGVGEKFAEASGVGDLPGTITDEVIAQAQAVLSLAQIEVLRQIQYEQASQADALRSLRGVVRDSQNP
jgi:RNA polymerase sigma factor (sigma-70 family)